MEKLAKILIGVLMVIIVAMPGASAAEQQAIQGKSGPEASPPEPPITVVMCSSCGGSYPFRLRRIEYKNVKYAVEYGESCSGESKLRADSNPEMCASHEIKQYNKDKKQTKQLIDSTSQ